jgi:hypothetical protein
MSVVFIIVTDFQFRHCTFSENQRQGMWRVKECKVLVDTKVPGRQSCGSGEPREAAIFQATNTTTLLPTS